MEVRRCRWRTSNHENGEFGRGRRANLGARLHAEVAAGWKPAVPGWGSRRFGRGYFRGRGQKVTRIGKGKGVAALQAAGLKGT